MVSNRIVACILARMGSTRLPRKMLLPLGGVPVLEHLVRRVQSVSQIDELVIATSIAPENDEIEVFCKTIGVKCFRGSEDDVLGRILGALRSENAQSGVCVFGDGPFLDPKIVSEVMTQYISSQGAVDFVGNDLKTTFPSGMEVEVFSVAALESASRKIKDPATREHGTLAMRISPDDFRLVNVQATAEHYFPELALELDTREDFDLLSYIANELYIGNPVFGLSDIIALYHRNPAPFQGNQAVVRRWKQYRST